MSEVSFTLRLNHANIAFDRHFIIFYITLHPSFHYFVFSLISTLSFTTSGHGNEIFLSRDSGPEGPGGQKC